MGWLIALSYFNTFLWNFALTTFKFLVKFLSAVSPKKIDLYDNALIIFTREYNEEELAPCSSTQTAKCC